MPVSRARLSAANTASERKPRVFRRPVGSDGSNLPVREFYGQNTFNLNLMRERLPHAVYTRFVATVEHGQPLDKALADAIAQAALDWALSRGVSHFCHWFQPMTGATAEKHDAFIAFDQARPIAKFTGAMLIQSEPDASSFPSGGMRSTFEARGYTAWDPTSPMFIMDAANGGTLCIPSAFVSYHGDALDQKTPLLRSMESINEAAVRLCRALGEGSTTRVIPTAGPEQEYFLVDRAWLALRPDLRLAGRTVIGARAPKGQTLEDHYFGTIPTRVLAFMSELDTELYKLGVPAKTRHNEVAPSQFEIAILYAEANVAADYNQLVMELLRRVAERHDLAALLHEKPFGGVNGSGKHLNWSMADNHGNNLLEPGETPHENLRFLAVLSSVLLGVYRYGGLLRASIASYPNDFRLGANEAPPAIISAFLGEQLTAVCDAITDGRLFDTAKSASTIAMGSRLPALARDTTDRNRTSPFAFTGNKFEFRAVGSSMSVSFPLTCVNTVVAEGMATVSGWIEEAGGGPEAVMAAVRRALVESKPVRFEGNNYSAEWAEEAARRGLPNLRATPEALRAAQNPEVEALFTRQRVLSVPELHSRFHVWTERYVTTVDVEVDVLKDLVDQVVLPAAVAERTVAATAISTLGEALGADAVSSDEREALVELTGRVSRVRTVRRTLEQIVAEASSLHGSEKADFYGGHVVPVLAELRAACDAVEVLVADERWPLPRYRELLFQN